MEFITVIANANNDKTQIYTHAYIKPFQGNFLDWLGYWSPKVWNYRFLFTVQMYRCPSGLPTNRVKMH